MAKNKKGKQKKPKTPSFEELEGVLKTDNDKRFVVRSRGRPKTEPAEAAEKAARRKNVGDELLRLRTAQGLTLNDAAERAGITSGRKLSQYERNCYPPGWVIGALAPIYRVEASYLAALVLANSDPEMYHALFGDMEG
jgi:hypothetical protein